jgi:hypothetical protein
MENLGGSEIVIFLLLLVFLVFIVIGTWKTFEKAGEPGWAAIIPFYNYYIMARMAGKDGWWVILCIIPYVGLIFQIILMNNIAKGFGKGGGMVLAMVFGIGWMMLGFGDAVWQNDDLNDMNPDVLHS